MIGTYTKHLPSKQHFAEKAAQAAQWIDGHPIHAAWITKAAAEGNEFAKSLKYGLNRYGSLTLNQLAAVSRAITQEENKKLQGDNSPNIAGAGLKKLEEMFAKAKTQGLKRPRLRIGDLTFMPAPSTGKNPGAIYVKRNTQYLGKILCGVWMPQDAYGLDATAEVTAIATDPLGAAVANGKKNGWCACCGKELTDPISVKAGIGPVCMKKFF